MIKVGIFLGGNSREREISFAGGRTAYDNLDKTLFEAIPIFVDSWGNLVQLDWQYVYKGSIRDFYPPSSAIPPTAYEFQIYAESLGELSPEAQRELLSQIGRPLFWEQLPEIIDFAFLVLHGYYGEDGSIQGILQYLRIPYTSSGILPSAIGMNKVFQKKVMQAEGFAVPPYTVVSRRFWLSADTATRQNSYQDWQRDIGVALVVKPANQGSSIGTSVIAQTNFLAMEQAIDAAFFVQKIEPAVWAALPMASKISRIQQIIDFRSGIGLPVQVLDGRAEPQILYHPDALLEYLQSYCLLPDAQPIYLAALDCENEVLIEQMIVGKEFSCVVVRDEFGNIVPLPPTEIRKGSEVFDYRAKYLPGLSRKLTPIDLPEAQIAAIRRECIRLFSYLQFNVYARIDGFITAEGRVLLNDPNTTSGMLPSSFFFHQAAEIGINPSQFLTYIIRQSLLERVQTGTYVQGYERLLSRLDNLWAAQQQYQQEKIRVAVIMGGYSSERHISIESGRNIYEKLASSGKYLPIPIFLTGSGEDIQLYTIPINVLLKDNADDIKEKLLNYKPHPITADIQQESRTILSRLGIAVADVPPERWSFGQLAQSVDAVFIALHGRPGEDGCLQAILEQYQLPYNGSNSQSSAITIDKYHTNQLLRQNGIRVAAQYLIYKADWLKNSVEVEQKLAAELGYPFIAKPVDDGCSSAVKKIKTPEELTAYMRLIFREQPELLSDEAKQLHLKMQEEFPQKIVFLAEELVEKKSALHFLEVTGGLLTHFNEKGEITYEMFEPSESLAGNEVLSLEEKFLAGEGQNITPARYAKNPEVRQRLAQKVMDELKKVAEILGIEGYCRTDAFVKIYEDEQVETYIIEVNSLPGMTPATAIFHQSALNGYTPYGFIDHILSFALQKKRQVLVKQQPIVS